MAVHGSGGTLVASTATTTSYTGWEKYVIVTASAPSSTAGTLSVTTDGTTATLNGDNASVRIPASGSVTVAVKNNFPKPQVSTTTPLATDPSAVPALTTYGSKVSIISDLAAPYSIDLAEDAGTLPIYS
jgi:hypothetical protein